MVPLIIDTSKLTKVVEVETSLVLVTHYLVYKWREERVRQFPYGLACAAESKVAVFLFPTLVTAEGHHVNISNQGFPLRGCHEIVPTPRGIELPLIVLSPFVVSSFVEELIGNAVTLIAQFVVR